MTRTAAQTAIAAHGRHWPAGVAMLTVPGLYGSGPGHWQSRWEGHFPDWRRVEQDDWSTPDLARWSARVGQAVRAAQAERPRHAPRAVLVAHSFGCLASLHWAVQARDAVAGVLLVAPADPDKFGVADQLPQRALPFPAVLVASRNDPWLGYGQALSGARAGARRWSTRAMPATSMRIPAWGVGARSCAARSPGQSCLCAGGRSRRCRLAGPVGCPAERAIYLKR